MTKRTDPPGLWRCGRGRGGLELLSHLQVDEAADVVDGAGVVAVVERAGGERRELVEQVRRAGGEFEVFQEDVLAGERVAHLQVQRGERADVADAADLGRDRGG